MGLRCSNRWMAQLFGLESIYVPHQQLWVGDALSIIQRAATLCLFISPFHSLSQPRLLHARERSVWIQRPTEPEVCDTGRVALRSESNVLLSALYIDNLYNKNNPTKKKFIGHKTSNTLANKFLFPSYPSSLRSWGYNQPMFDLFNFSKPAGFLARVWIWYYGQNSKKKKKNNNTHFKCQHTIFTLFFRSILLSSQVYRNALQEFLHPSFVFQLHSMYILQTHQHWETPTLWY